MKKRGDMNKGAKSFFSAVFVFAVTLSVLFMASFVIADIAEYSSLSAGSFAGNISTINEDVYVLYTITVNNTDGVNNITAVNITLPSGFSFGSVYNTTAANATFATSSATMNWSNGTATAGRSGLINGSFGAYFVFNITSPTPGKYNISLEISDMDTGHIERNLTVHVNDTTAPTAVSLFPAAGGFNVGGNALNISNTTLYINVTANDSHSGINTINISLTNASGIVQNTTYNFSNLVVPSAYGGIMNGTNIGANSSGIVNWYGLLEGVYHLNVSVNDTSNNKLSTFSAIVRVDTTVPTVTLTEDTKTSSELTITVTKTDATSGVEASTCTVSGGNNPALNSDATSFTDSGLTCSNAYSYVVTCDDYAGNQASSTNTEFTTSGCGGSSSGGGGGGTTWTKTYSENNQELSLKGSVTQELSANHRMRLLVSGETHYVGIKSISGGKATIEVASTPQEKEMAAGESGKFDVTGDGTYDLLVTVESIEGSKANVKVEYIQEEVTEETQNGGTAEEQEEGGLLGGLGNSEGTGLSTGAWVAIVIALIIIIALVVFFVRKNR